MNDVIVNTHFKNIGVGWNFRKYLLLFLDSDEFVEKWGRELRTTAKKKRRRRRRLQSIVKKGNIVPNAKFPAVKRENWEDAAERENLVEIDKIDKIDKIDDDFLPVAGEEFSSDDELLWLDD